MYEAIGATEEAIAVDTSVPMLLAGEEAGALAAGATELTALGEAAALAVIIVYYKQGPFAPLIGAVALYALADKIF